MTEKEIPLGLTYDDVLLIPRKSYIKTRKQVDLSTSLTTSIALKIPVVAANMDTVCESAMAIKLAEMGGIGIVHRFMPAVKHAKEIENVKAKDKNLLVGAAVGVEDSDIKTRAKECVSAGADVLVLDIAHGHSHHAINAIKSLKDSYPDKDLIAGNIATPQGAEDLAEAGADAVKVGVGPGGVCTTRLVAGVGVPQFTAIMETADSEIDIPIIADGGIRHSGDIAKAIAAGADTVMIGSLLAGTKESPGEVELVSGGLVKRVRGMASFEASVMRAERNGEELEDDYFAHRSPEGVESCVPYSGEAAKIVTNLMGGLKSAMSYLDAKNFDIFRANASFIRVTGAGIIENQPHASYSSG